MRAGLLTETIKIQRPVTVSSNYSEGSIEYEDYISTRARVVHLAGKRIERGGRIEGVYGVQFTIRLYHKVEYGMIIIHDGNRYMINDINKDKARSSVIITGEVWYD